MPLGVVLSLSLGASPKPQESSNVLVSTPAGIDSIPRPPAWTVGYYAWIWAPEASRSRGGEDATLGVQFTGEWNATAGLLALGVKEEECDEAQKSYCDSQVDFNVAGGKSREEARKEAMKTYETCKACLMTKADAKDFPPPFSMKAGKYRGAQYLSLGGGANAPPWTVEMASILNEEIQAVRDAGFTGICFDIEAISGGLELIDAFEDTFGRCRRMGVDVFITTSHSAPYEAESDEARIAMVDAWAKSDNIGYISPQLYTQGGEAMPDLDTASGVSGPVEWDHYKGCKAKFVPSIVTTNGIDDMKAFFSGKGVHVDGFVQWGQVPDVSGVAGADACVAHGICGTGSKAAKQ